MVQATSELHDVNQRLGQSGGISENELHNASGLRSSVATLSLQSDNEALVTAFLVDIAGSLNGAAVALGELNAAGVNISDITSTGWVDVPPVPLKNGGFLAVPSTLCLNYFTVAPVASARSFTWRVTGWDQFGNHIRETVPAVSITNGLEQNDAAAAGPTTRSWTSHVFASVELIEVSKTDTSGAGGEADVISIGTCYKWDRADGQAQLYHDGTGGDYTLTVTIGTAAPLTTGVIVAAATAEAVRSALEALGNIVDVTVDVPAMSNPALFDNNYRIFFNDPVLGKEALTVGTNSLSGPNSNTIIITGEFHHNRDGNAIACPLETIPAGPVGRNDNLYPDIIGGSVIVPQDTIPVTTIGIVSTTTTTDIVTLASPHGFEVGETWIVVITEQTAIKTARNDVIAVATATTDVSFTLNESILTTGSVGGEASWNTHSVADYFQLEPAPGTRATPTGAGWRVGVSDANTGLVGHKMMLFLDGNAGIALSSQLANPFPSGHRTADRFGTPMQMQFWVRSTVGTGRDPTDVSTYPQ